MSDDAIVVEGLEKSYGSVRALCSVDFSAPTGSVLGLLGPNGAGKTTAVRILATLLQPDGGTARVAGLDTVRDAAKLHGLAALRAGATWQELQAALNLAFLFGGLSVSNGNATILDEIADKHDVIRALASLVAAAGRAHARNGPSISSRPRAKPSDPRPGRRNGASANGTAGDPPPVPTSIIFSIPAGV